MCRVSLLCQDASLRQRLRDCLEQAGFTVCMHPCQAKALVLNGSPLTPTQVEVLQAYVDTGDVGEVARLRSCSEETVRRHLAEARRRVRAKNVAQLVHIAWALGVLTIGILFLPTIWSLGRMAL